MASIIRLLKLFRGIALSVRLNPGGSHERHIADEIAILAAAAGLGGGSDRTIRRREAGASRRLDRGHGRSQRQPDRRMNDLRRLIADDGVARSILAAVAAATILAFGFDAAADVVASMLVVGLVTALAESRFRSAKKS
ncbi:hypothetical protein [Afipia sp. GAS231]|uniref:hypothetical protein n=1 Tax=Afipia sp. GAS231 TaxID=1882747 RepID=UPI001FCCCADC|nr:hypothetical protein [Afipia sp. GAS231]